MRPCSSRPSLGSNPSSAKLLHNSGLILSSAEGWAGETAGGCAVGTSGCGQGLLDAMTRLPSTQLIGPLAASEAIARIMSAVGAGGGGTHGSLNDA